MRDRKFEWLGDDISLFCGNDDIMIPDMDASHFPEKTKRIALNITYYHYLRIEIFLYCYWFTSSRI